MIDDSLVKQCSVYVASDEPLKPELSRELLSNYIALIEQNAELHKKLAHFSVKEEKCMHPIEHIVTKYDHNECKLCGSIKTDSGFGVASNMWFDNLQAVKFYENNGFLP